MARTKGAVGKFTVAAKQAMDLAFEGLGGAKALQEWASANRGDFYKLWSKRIPTAVEGTGANGEIVIRITRD